MSKILLSICIPTNGRIDILKNTLDSILYQTNDFSEFEVVLSDNSTTDELPELLKQYTSYTNIVYQKTTVSGFLNSINALRMGTGLLLKLHNNYTEFRKGSLEIMLETIRQHHMAKPLLFFSNRSLKNITIEDYYSFDKFMCSLSYFSSWSTGFSIWNSDFYKYSNIEYDKMFPHTSLLFELNKKGLYIINNKELFFNQNISSKGGYNLFKTFCVEYLGMLDNLLKEENITRRTFLHIKKHMYFNFLIPWYYSTKVKKNNFTYDLTGIRESMIVHYSFIHYKLMVIIAWSFFPIKNMCFSILKYCKSNWSGKGIFKNL